jgi:vanillate O-demethylase ferredoxin subunit
MYDKYFDAVVLSRRSLSDRIAEFEIGAADGAPLPMAEAGSHIELRFSGEDGPFLRHYSVVGPLTLSDKPEPFWRIAVQRENRSRGSAFIHDHFRAGVRLRISRPINAFRLSRNQPHTLLVAGGIGITPMFAMARSLRVRKGSFSMMYAGLKRSAMAYADDLQRLCEDRLVLHETERDGIPDLKGLLSKQPEGTTAYICGPGPMIEALRDAGRALGWDDPRIRFEVFNAAHKPQDVDFEVKERSGRAIRVGAGTTILDALEVAGIGTLSDCRRGECGLCVTDVVGCDGGLDHRDRFFNDEEHAKGEQITICCSRIRGHVLELDI